MVGASMYGPAAPFVAAAALAAASPDIKANEKPFDYYSRMRREGHDRIVAITDTDGDGRADRRQVFAEQLSIPTSMLAQLPGCPCPLALSRARPHVLCFSL
jgi:hypothetical protein